jgi:tetratricopeptide (TPR) repeat protein
MGEPRMMIFAPIILAGESLPCPATNTLDLDQSAHQRSSPDLKAAAQPASSDGLRAYKMARACADRRDLPAAQTWLHLALQQEPMLAPAHYLDGMIWQELGQLDAALRAMRRCVYADPSFVLAHVALSRQFLQLGQPERSLIALRNAISLLEDRAPDELITEGDGLMVRQLQNSIYTLARDSLAALCLT